MRVAERDLMEKAVLLECLNEDLRERCEQLCRRCGGVVLGTRPNRHTCFV